MKVEFKKIPNSGIGFETKFEDVKFYGEAKKVDRDLVKATGVMEGSFKHICDRCGDNFVKVIKLNFEIFASNGIYEGDDYHNLIEFFDGFVNFDTMLQSELESLKCEYLYCKTCDTENKYILGE